MALHLLEDTLEDLEDSMANQVIKQSEPIGALRRVRLKLVDASDGMTPETGETGGVPQYSINGSSFASTANSLVSIGNGSYYVEMEVSEVSEKGSLEVRYKSANTAEFADVIQIVEAETTTMDQLKAMVISLSNKIDYMILLAKLGENDKKNKMEVTQD